MDVVCVEYGTLGEAREALCPLGFERVATRLLVRVPPAVPGRIPPGIQAHTLPANRGFGHACNRGAGQGSAPWILFLNPDCRLSSSGLGALLVAGRSRPDVGALAPRLVDEEGREARSHGVWPRSPRRLLDVPRPPGGDAPRGPHGVDWLPATCLLLRRRAFEEVGGFDERFFLYFEDVDLCHQLAARGHSRLLVPGVTALHRQGSGSFPHVGAQAAAWREGRRRYLAKHGTLLDRLLWRAWRGAQALGAWLSWKDFP